MRGFVATVVKRQSLSFHFDTLASFDLNRKSCDCYFSLSHSYSHSTGEIDSTYSASALFGFMWPNSHGLLAVLMSLVYVGVEVTFTGTGATCLSPLLGSDDASLHSVRQTHALCTSTHVKICSFNVLAMKMNSSVPMPVLILSQGTVFITVEKRLCRYDLNGSVTKSTVLTLQLWLLSCFNRHINQK